jgi:hypothetical protein
MHDFNDYMIGDLSSDGAPGDHTRDRNTPMTKHALRIKCNYVYQASFKRSTDFSIDIPRQLAVSGYVCSFSNTTENQKVRYTTLTTSL